MEPSKYTELSNKILDNPTERFCEIYKITNLTNGKNMIWIFVGSIAFVFVLFGFCIVKMINE
jgi:hypothetical protein